MENNKDKTETDAYKPKNDENEYKVGEKATEPKGTGHKSKDLESEHKKKETKQKISIFLSRNFRWLLLVWLLLIFLVGFFFFIWPKYKAITSLSVTEREQKEEEYSKNKKYLDEAEELIAVYKKINKADIEKFNLVLPLKNVQEELFSKLKEIVVANGLILESLGIGEEEKKSSRGIIIQSQSAEDDNSNGETDLPKKIGKVKVNLGILGIDYFSLVSLLNSIERNLRLLDVTNIDFSPDNNLLVLELYTYYLKE